MPDDIDIAMEDIRLAGHCTHQRDWWRQHGIYDEFKVLTKGGSIPASVILATGDPRAIQVVERKRARGRSHG